MLSPSLPLCPVVLSGSTHILLCVVLGCKLPLMEDLHRFSICYKYDSNQLFGKSTLD